MEYFEKRAAKIKYDIFGNRNEQSVTVGGVTTVTEFALDRWSPANPAGVGNTNFNVLADLNGYSSLITRYICQCEGVEMHDLSENDRVILRRIKGYTMTSVERQIALAQAVRYIVRRGICGCIVECGVWRGGSTMAAALTLAQEGDIGRDLYLFDTFEGMTKPTGVDRTFDGLLAQELLDRDVEKTRNVSAFAGIAEVRRNMTSTGYPQERVHFVQGPVEATIPCSSLAGPIALLRLDTDWYESTKHELVHLFPLLAEGGILIIDDYGHWEGARKAVDEFLADQPRHYYMHRIDYSGRLIVKQ